jgi:hypothetical protein
MPRTCTVCTNSRRDDIEAALVRGDSSRSISRQFGISKDAPLRHKKHLALAMAKSQEGLKAPDGNGISYRSRLVGVTEGLIADLQKLKRAARRKRDIRAAGKVIDSAFRGIELLAKLMNVVDSRAQHQELHLHLTPERAAAVKSLLGAAPDGVADHRARRK